MSERKPIRLVVIRSRSHREMLSLRLEDEPDAGSATSIRRALAETGYKPGDVVELVPVAGGPEAA